MFFSVEMPREAGLSLQPKARGVKTGSLGGIVRGIVDGIGRKNSRGLLVTSLKCHMPLFLFETGIL